MSEIHSSTVGRTSSFSRNTDLEILLKDINSNLWFSEQTLLQQQGELQYLIILVMGPHRSGSTLFMQWLANTGLVAYPTNLLSRFYQAPIIGAKIQLLLTDPRFNFRDELGEFTQQAEYRSEIGKTKGVLAPNEFWYFWRRFLADPSRDIWTDEELRQSMDTRTLLAELVGMMNVFQKPFAAKGMLFNYNIPFLDSVLDKVIFVQIKRDIETNTASVLEARKRQLGDEAAWYSFDIPEKKELMKLNPHEQARGQIEAINSAVDKGMSQVDSSRKLFVQYEEFCANPASCFQEITKKIGMDNIQYSGPDSFIKTR
jgi:hypothetical protein